MCLEGLIALNASVFSVLVPYQRQAGCVSVCELTGGVLAWCGLCR